MTTEEVIANVSPLADIWITKHLSHVKLSTQARADLIVALAKAHQWGEVNAKLDEFAKKTG